MSYHRRAVDDIIDDLFPSLPALLLDGPKAVGKTTTALQRAKTVRNLDVEAERLRATVDPEWVITGTKPILIDEWHTVADTWGTVKRAVDNDHSGGQFILTGSMPDSSTHSGAGRITAIRMRPLSFAEREVSITSVSFGALLQGNADISGETDVSFSDYSDELMRSGFPALRDLEGNALRVALDGYIERIVDADIKELGVTIRKPAIFRSWMTSYAAATGTVASWEKIRDAANPGSGEVPAKTTVIPYRDALTRLRILDELPPWLPSHNQFRRAATASKHYLADPALALRLMNFTAESITTADAYGGGTFNRPLVGRMFESLAVLSVRTYAEANFAKAMHFRDAAGTREIDIIVERQDGKVLAIEVKLGQTVNDDDLVHLKWLRSELGDDLIDCVVLYSGPFAYRHDGIAFIPLALLGL
jgi:uncharacterized protein